MDIEIKRAGLCDKDFVLYANKEIDRVSYIEKSTLKDNVCEDVLQGDKGVCLIAKCKGIYAGMILFSKVYWADRGLGIYVSQVFVEKEFRRNNVFKMLLLKAQEFYPNIKFVTFLVSKKNLTMLKCAQKMGCEDEDMVCFAKILSDSATS